MQNIGVAVINKFYILDEDSIKSKLLYFDKLTIIKKFGFNEFNTSEILLDKINKFNHEIDFLGKHDLIEEAKIDAMTDFILESANNPENKKLFRLFYEAYKALKVKHEKLITSPTPVDDKTLQDFYLHEFATEQLGCRAFNTYLNAGSPNMHTPILQIPIDAFLSSQEPSINVLDIVINRFPILDKDIPLEKLVEFKQDEDSRRKLLRLKDWMTDISKTNLTEKEIAQKLDSLLEEYVYHMSIHKLRHKVAKAHWLIIPSMEFVESFPFIKFSKAAKAVFELELNRISLFDAENKAVGREIAYIQRLNEYFPPKS